MAVEKKAWLTRLMARRHVITQPKRHVVRGRESGSVDMGLQQREYGNQSMDVVHSHAHLNWGKAVKSQIQKKNVQLVVQIVHTH